MTLQQTWLFDEVAEQTAPSTPPKRMELVDCDNTNALPNQPVRAIYRCSNCEHETDWIDAANFTEARKGLPCPRCN